MSEWKSTPTCFLCHCNASIPLEQHHKVFRSHGGQEGENLVLLCKVCHGATHGLKTIVGNHSCKTCSVRRTYGCYFGERVLGETVKTPPPWVLKENVDVS